MFKDGLKHGKGTLIYPNHKKAEGSWLDDKKHGSFKITSETGKKTTVEYNNGGKTSF
jgi:hypothetical protein